MSPTRTSDRERGFSLAGLIVILTIIMVFIAFTVPRQWSMVMQRDRERQTMFVMKQYARSISDYSKTKRRRARPNQTREARPPRPTHGPNGETADPPAGK